MRSGVQRAEWSAGSAGEGSGRRGVGAAAALDLRATVGEYIAHYPTPHLPVTVEPTEPCTCAAFFVRSTGAAFINMRHIFL